MQRFFFFLLIAFAACQAFGATCNTATSVTTERFDAARDGVQTGESAINQTTVANNFQQAAVYSTTDNIWANPLVCDLGTGSPSKILIVASADGVLWGFDANAKGTPAPLWQTAVTNSPSTDCAGAFAPNGRCGIVATPVIDPATAYVYVEYQDSTGAHHLGAWNAADGTQAIAPITIDATDAGTGVQFSATGAGQIERNGLGLNAGMVYVSYASHGDAGTWRDWVISFDSSTLAPVASYCGTCAYTGGGGGMWGGLTIDPADGSLFLTTGNAITNSTGDYNPGVVHLDGSTLSLIDWMAPSDYQTRTAQDLDFTTQPIIMNNDFIIAAGKGSPLYVLNKAALGYLQGGIGNPPVFQQFPNQASEGVLYRSGIVATSTDVWTAGAGGIINRFHWVNNTVGLDATNSPLAAYAQGNEYFGNLGPQLSYSWDGANQNTAILWCECNVADGYAPTAGTLNAYEPLRLTLLYSSGTLPSDALGNNPKLTGGAVIVPGPNESDRVFVPTRSSQVVAFGLAIPTTISVTPQAAPFSTSSQSIGLTSTISASTTVNSGTVTYVVTDSGSVQVGSPVTSGIVASNVAPVVQYTLPANTPSGTYTITATYSDEGGFLTSTGTATLTVQVPVTVASTPSGLSFSVSGTGCAAGSGLISPQTLSWTPGSSCTVTFATPQAGSSGTQYVFSSWEDNSTNAARSIAAPSSPTTYTAAFNAQYQLTVAASPSGGGSVTPLSGQFYNSGATVNLLAVSNANYGFADWSGSSVADSTSAATTVTMTAPQSVVANFSSLTYTQGALVQNRKTGVFTQSVTVTNNGPALTGSVAYVTDGLASGVSLVNSSGSTSATTPTGSPYLEVGPIGANSSVTATLEFTRTGTQAITYTTRLLGPGPR